MTKFILRGSRVAALAVILAGLLVGTAQADSVRLHASHHIRHWESAQSFAVDDYIETAAYVNGHLLQSTNPEGGCRGYWVGDGVVVQTVTCGTGPLRASFVSFRGPVDVRLTYRKLFYTP